ncbi:RNA 2',3'-cyclic phosphodiesterase [Deinococcus altitudinis]|uniref:RNA 2',3'-cyclic phosphodiesterase n=1 Tax=Deinococcus altitudinis TaxID=468914 RepID=UPI003891D8B0
MTRPPAEKRAGKPAAPRGASDSASAPGNTAPGNTAPARGAPRRGASTKGAAEGGQLGKHPGKNKPGVKAGGKPVTAAPARERVLRLFFGLALPEAVSAELAQAQAKLSSNWRKVEEDQLHITLAYLPGVPEAEVAKLRELGTRLAAEAGPMTLRLRGTGYHPNVGTPRVWFVKLEGEGLAELAARFAAELETLGFPVEGKFQPHVTLARKKGPAPRLPPLNFTQEWEAAQLHLIHTFLPRDKTGPVYDTVSRFRLTGAAPMRPLSPEPPSTSGAPETPSVPDHHFPEEPDGKVE